MKITGFTLFVFVLALQGQIARAWSCQNTRPGCEGSGSPAESENDSIKYHLNCTLENGQTIQFTLNGDGTANAISENRTFYGSYQDYLIGGQTRLTGTKALDIYESPTADSSQPELPYESIFAALNLIYPQFSTGWGEIYFRNKAGRPFAQSAAECSTDDSKWQSAEYSMPLDESYCCTHPWHCRYCPRT